MHGIYTYGVPSGDVFVLVAIGEGWSIWFLLYCIMSQPHYTLLTLCGGYPIEGRDLYEWVFYIL